MAGIESKIMQFTWGIIERISKKLDLATQDECDKLLKAFSQPILVQEDLSLNYYLISMIYLGFGDGFFD